jgi:hypothetical protein
MLTGLAQKEYLSLANVGIPSFNLLVESKKYPAGAANFIKLPTVINLELVLEYVPNGAGYPSEFLKYPVVSLANVVL